MSKGWGNLKIGVRLIAGFLIVIILAGVVGIVGINASSSIRGGSDMMNKSDDLSRTLLEARRSEKNWIMRNDEQYLTEVKDYVASGKTLAQEIADEFNDKEVTNSCKVIQTSLDKYLATFLDYVEKAKANDGVLTVWKQVGDDFNALVADIRGKTGRGDDIYLQADTLESKFILMRVAALYFIKDRTDARWDAFVTSMQDTETEAKKLTEMTASNSLLAASASTIQTQINKYISESDIYHGNVLAQIADEEGWKPITSAMEGSADEKNEFYGGAALISAIAQNNMESTQKSSLVMVIAFIAAAVVIGLLIAVVIMRGITRPVNSMKEGMKKIALGDVTEKINLASRDEVGQMADSYREMQGYLQAAADNAEKIATGDLTITVTPKSEKDTLNQSLVKMVANLKKSMEEVRQKVDYLNQVPTPIMVASPEFDVLFMNNAGATAVGRKPEDCVGKKCFSLFNTGDCNTDKCAVAKAFRHGGIFTSESIARLPGGDLPIRYTGAPIKDSNGKIIAATEYVLDVTKEKAAVARMTEVSENLAVASEQLSSASKQSGSATEQIASVSQQVAKGAEEQTKGIGEVTSAINELGKAIEQVNTGSTEQSKAVEQATGIVQQVSSAAEQTATSAQEAANSATKAADVAKQGTSTVEKTIDGIRKINLSMQDVAGKVAELGKHSEEIGGMIAVIDDIASQTNLLALNAAIEAARAGEQGRGFAVVADEVKKLAERTAKETKEIAALVGTVQKGVSDSIKASTDGAKQAEEGSSLANEAGAALGQILDAITSMTSQIEQISAAAEEMSASAAEMVKVVDGVSKIAEQNLGATKQMEGNKAKVTESANSVAATIEENGAATQQMSASAQEMSAQVQQVVSSAEALSTMAGELQKTIDMFKLSNQDGSADSGSAHSSGNGKKTKSDAKATVRV
jgi:PAS domain S-box-containing protein